MRLIDKTIQCKSRSDKFYLYVLGDIHLGTRNCAEKNLKRLIGKINKEPNALWIGGGDYCECIKPSDLRRYEADTLPDWILGPSPDDARENLRDVVAAQWRRFKQLIDPIADKCLGLIEGNHCSQLRKYQNIDHIGFLCNAMWIPYLTSEAFLRLRFRARTGPTTARVVKVYISHGHGGGRTAGAEPNHLFRLTSSWDADIIYRGHSHSFCILPPQVTLGVPSSGKLPDECVERVKRAANWGCWLRYYKSGPSNYVSRANYSPRPLSTVETEIQPLTNSRHSGPMPLKISMKELTV